MRFPCGYVSHLLFFTYTIFFLDVLRSIRPAQMCLTVKFGRSEADRSDLAGQRPTGRTSLSSSTTTETLICPGWETSVVLVSQPGTPGRDKRGALLSRVWQPGQKNRDKRCCQRPRGWRTLLSRLVLTTGTKCPFSHIFLFSILFLFQLYFCISIKLCIWIQCVWSPLIYTYI